LRAFRFNHATHATRSTRSRVSSSLGRAQQAPRPRRRRTRRLRRGRSDDATSAPVFIKETMNLGCSARARPVRSCCGPTRRFTFPMWSPRPDEEQNQHVQPTWAASIKQGGHQSRSPEIDRHEHRARRHRLLVDNPAPGRWSAMPRARLFITALFRTSVWPASSPEACAVRVDRLGDTAEGRVIPEPVKPPVGG